MREKISRACKPREADDYEVRLLQTGAISPNEAIDRCVTAKRKRNIVPHTADQMFALVADVERYPEFLPWCAELHVIAKEETDTGVLLTADMAVAYGPIKERFRSLVRLDRAARRIDVDYVEGPFRSLKNEWRFEQKPQGGSVVDFCIEFEFRNRVLQSAAHALFDRVFLKMSDAFVARARAVYGVLN